MLLAEYARTAGEHQHILSIDGRQIEILVSVPDAVNWNYIAFLGHPHSLQGGTMNNKVVTTMARVFKALGIPSLRFNFRGVGQSSGVYDEGIGESEDMLCLVNHWQKMHPEAKLIFAGFSFGSYVAYRAAAQVPHELLVTIAPPVHHYNYHGFSKAPAPWIILQGDEDEVVPLKTVLEFTEQDPALCALIRFAKTGHFFHGKLLELKACLIKAIQSKISLS